jgi:subtilisin family serine protease
MKTQYIKITLLVLVGFVMLIGYGGFCQTYDNSSNSGSSGQKALTNIQNNGGVRKIVVFNSEVSHERKGAIISEANGVILKHLHIINGSAVVIPPSAIGRMKARGEIKRIDDDIEVYATGKPAPTPPSQSLPWGINRIDADLAWTYSQGSTVKVAILDTGIDYTHPDLAGNVKGGINTITPTKSYMDDNGHGTHVAGITAALNNTVGVIGVGPQISLYAVKALNKNGSGYLSDIIEGLQWSIDNHMQVINMSLGSSSDNLSFHQAVQAVYQAGITQVAAAGNDGAYNTVNYPAKYPEVIAVSAIDGNGQLAYFSSYGPEITIAAPGVNIYSTYKGGAYKTLNGTSMAAPHVTGTVALKLAQGIYTPDQIKIILQNTAENLNLPSTAQGAGLVDAEKVVQY